MPLGKLQKMSFVSKRGCRSPLPHCTALYTDLASPSPCPALLLLLACPALNPPPFATSSTFATAPFFMKYSCSPTNFLCSHLRQHLIRGQGISIYTRIYCTLCLRRDGNLIYLQLKQQSSDLGPVAESDIIVICFIALITHECLPLCVCVCLCVFAGSVSGSVVLLTFNKLTLVNLYVL